MKKPSYLIYFILFFLIALGGIVWLVLSPGKYDDFAVCLVSSGTKMYGTWWCPHCTDQKNAFGKSWNLFSSKGGYVECATQTYETIEICKIENITGYPTWRFSDGSELSGKQDFKILSLKTDCPLLN